MIAVIFEIWAKPGQKQRYLDLAAELRPLLETIDGFISIERFESLYEPGKMLSLSFFRDEAAVSVTWKRSAISPTYFSEGLADWQSGSNILAGINNAAPKALASSSSGLFV